MIFVTGKSVTGDDCTSFRGDDSVADEFLRYESKPGFRDEYAQCDHFRPIQKLKKILKEMGLH